MRKNLDNNFLLKLNGSPTCLFLLERGRYGCSVAAALLGPLASLALACLARRLNVIQPGNWLRRQLELTWDHNTGLLDKTYPILPSSNGWLNATWAGRIETLPWRGCAVLLAHLSQDNALLAKAKRRVDWTCTPPLLYPLVSPHQNAPATLNTPINGHLPVAFVKKTARSCSDQVAFAMPPRKPNILLFSPWVPTGWAMATILPRGRSLLPYTGGLLSGGLLSSSARTQRPRTRLTLRLPMPTHTSDRPRNSRALARGPLVCAFRIMRQWQEC